MRLQSFSAFQLVDTQNKENLLYQDFNNTLADPHFQVIQFKSRATEKQESKAKKSET